MASEGIEHFKHRPGNVHFKGVSLHFRTGHGELADRSVGCRGRCMTAGTGDRIFQIQQALFRKILGGVSTVVMMLVLYTLTLDKLHDIAMLKLLGARRGVIVGMILQQALIIGCLSFALACLIGSWAYPHFPRRVVIVRSDQVVLFAIVVGISALASLVGIRKALRTDVGEVLS